MTDDRFFCDLPGQFLDGNTIEFYRHAEAEIEAEVRKIEEATTDLSRLLEEPHLTLDHLQHWIHEDYREVRTELFGSTVWGRIKWNRSYGQPQTARMADAFSFLHWYLWLDMELGPDGRPRVEKKWVQLPTPRVWDGPHDEENYRVSFLARATPVLLNQLSIGMVPVIQWDPPLPPWSSNRWSLRWPENMLPRGQFTVSANEILVLDDYELVKLFV
jgi:hypothetical protein